MRIYGNTLNSVYQKMIYVQTMNSSSHGALSSGSDSDSAAYSPTLTSTTGNHFNTAPPCSRRFFPEEWDVDTAFTQGFIAGARSAMHSGQIYYPQNPSLASEVERLLMDSRARGLQQDDFLNNGRDADLDYLDQVMRGINLDGIIPRGGNSSGGRSSDEGSDDELLTKSRLLNLLLRDNHRYIHLKLN